MEDNKKLLDSIAKLEKTFGKGIVMSLEDDNIQLPRTSSGSIKFDMALGGGVPNGRIIEYYGAESSGKTTLALHNIIEYQKDNKKCAFVDAEHSFDKGYAKAIGVNTKELLVSQPDCGEDAFTVIEALVQSGVVKCIVVDSVAALTPKAEIEGDFGDSKMGLHARLMSQAMRKLTGISHRNDCTLIFINQTRDKIGVMYGNPETTTGGNALKFYASIRVKFTKSKGLEDNGERTTSHVKVEVVKNKTAPPFRKAEFEIRFGEGVDKASEIVDIGTELGIITKAGSWYSYGDAKIGQGKQAVTEFMKDNPELFEEIKGQVYEKLK